MTTLTDSPWPRQANAATGIAPVAGKIFEYEGRLYETLGSAPQTPPRVAMRTTCVDCGRRFNFTLPADWQARGFRLNWLCLTCLPDRRGKIRTWRADDCQTARR